jgi:hypothetical protein
MYSRGAHDTTDEHPLKLGYFTRFGLFDPTTIRPSKNFHLAASNAERNFTISGGAACRVHCLVFKSPEYLLNLSPIKGLVHDCVG